MYSTATSSALFKQFFNKFKGLLGRMNEVVLSDLASNLLYLTNLWASVATKVISSVPSSQYTPLITGRRSSFPVAKIVLLIALRRTLLATLRELD